MKWRRIRFWGRALVPVVLLSIVFSKIELAKLLENLRDVDGRLLLSAAVVGYMSQIFLAALRWKLALRSFYGIRLPYLALIRLCWEGMFVGYFVPAGLGADIYRVAGAGKRSGAYAENTALIVGEKFLLLVGSALILMAAYPLARTSMATQPRIEAIIRYTYLAGIVGATLVLAAGLLLKAKWGQQALAFVHRRTGQGIRIMLTKIGLPQEKQPENDVMTALVRPFFRPGNLALILGFTALNRIFGSLGGLIMLKAVGVDLPLGVHLFAWTLMFLIFTLPISVGTLGVREGAFVIIFGLFGVESETALAASFVGLACLMTTTVTGGLILCVNNIRNRAEAEACDAG